MTDVRSRQNWKVEIPINNVEIVDNIAERLMHVTLSKICALILNVSVNVTVISLVAYCNAKNNNAVAIGGSKKGFEVFMEYHKR
ncbi:hypothetical protein NBRC116494_05450 [Aurantivibrio plasticivorans]